MDTDVTAVKAALVELSDAELHALIDATHGVPRIATKVHLPIRS